MKKLEEFMRQELEQLGDEHQNMLVSLLEAGVSSEDAEIAIRLDSDIRAAKPLYVAGPIEYVGKMPPIEKSWARFSAGEF